jgi:hypothetical protein
MAKEPPSPTSTTLLQAQLVVAKAKASKKASTPVKSKTLRQNRTRRTRMSSPRLTRELMGRPYIFH